MILIIIFEEASAVCDQIPIAVVGECCGCRQIRGYGVCAGATVSILPDRRERVCAVGQSDVRARKCTVGVANRRETVHCDTRGRTPGRADDRDGAAAGNRCQLVQTIHIESLDEGAIRPVTQVSAGVVGVAKLLVHAVRRSAGLFSRCGLQLARGVVGIIDVISPGPRLAGPAAGVIVTVGVRVQRSVAAVFQIRTSHPTQRIVSVCNVASDWKRQLADPKVVAIVVHIAECPCR